MLLQNTLITTLHWDIHSHCPLSSSTSASLHLNIHLEDHLHFIISLKISEVLISNFIKSSNHIFNIYYILQYLHHDVRWDLVHNIQSTVIYILNYEYVLSLKVAFIAEICCWWLLIAEDVFRLKIPLFYLLVYLNTMGMPCQK